MPVKSRGRHPEKSKRDLKVRGESDPQRRRLLLYLVAIALVLWFWQEAVNRFG